MHEQSLVKSLLRQVDEVLIENRGSWASSVEVEIGPLSGVEADLVRSAFEQLSAGTRCSNATLLIQLSLLVVRCRDCLSESRLAGFVFRCHHCGSGNVQVISGDALRLLSVTMDSPVEIEHA